MFRLFKKKARAEDVAVGLTMLAAGTYESDAGSVRFLQSREVKFNEQQVLDELRCLRVFAVEFAIWSALREPERRTVLDAYHANLAKVGNTDTESRSTLTALAARVVRYKNAAATPHHIGPVWTVGCQFAELCGAKEDINLVTTGGMTFKTMCKVATDYLAAFRIV